MKGKRVLITGASSGVGHLLAESFLEKGYKVYCAARRVDKMSDLAEKGATALKLDLYDDQSVTECVNAVIADCGAIDILVNNAGYGLYGPIETVPIREAKKQFEVNVFGAARMSQLLIPYMRENGGGRIINISSVAGKIYSPMSGWYVASKFALEGLSDCMRIELNPYNIKVVLIEPSTIKSEWADGALGSLEENTKNTAYEDFGVRSAKMLKGASSGFACAETGEIVKVIVKAATAEKPKTRYLCGRIAGLSMFGRGIMPDKLFDKVMLSQLNRYKVK